MINNKKRNNQTTTKHRSYDYTKKVTPKSQGIIDNDYLQNDLQDYLEQLKVAKNANISAYELNKLKAKLLKVIKPPTSSWLYKANYDLLQNKINKLNNFINDIRELKSNVSKTRQTKKFLDLFDKLSIKLKENVLLLEDRLNVLEVSNLKEVVDKNFDNLYIKINGMEKSFYELCLENKNECRVLKKEIIDTTEKSFNELSLENKNIVENIERKFNELSSQNTNEHQNLKNDMMGKFEKISEELDVIKKTNESEQKLYKTLSNTQYSDLMYKLDKQKIPDEVMDIFKNSQDRTPLEIKKSLFEALEEGTITKKEFKEAIKYLKEHTTACKNEIMFDIVNVLSDFTSKIVGKKNIDDFINSIDGDRNFLQYYKKYINVILNILIITFFGAMLGGYISSEFFSKNTNKSLENIFTQTKENNKSLSFIRDNMQKRISYEFTKDSHFSFDKRSAILKPEDINKTKNICNDFKITKVYIIGYSNNKSFQDSKKRNYNDNFNLSLARANAVKKLVYEECKDIDKVDIVNIVKENNESKYYQKVDIEFYKQINGVSNDK